MGAAPQEKRARPMVTRPEPTIFGNCDSWDFIVGKKPCTYSRQQRPGRALYVRNEILSTTYQQIDKGFPEQHVGDLWMPCEQEFESRNMVCKARNMPKIDDQVKEF